MKKIVLGLFLLVSAVFATDIGTTTGSDDNSTEICLGYTPSYVMVVNETDNLVDEKFVGMDTNKTVLTTGSTGVITYDETTNITIGTVTNALGASCYGFSYVNSGADVLMYKANR
jgi:hypothetical protein